jgi:hypothetical protein
MCSVEKVLKLENLMLLRLGVFSSFSISCFLMMSEALARCINGREAASLPLGASPDGG